MLSGGHSIQIPVLEKCGRGWGWSWFEIKVSARSLILASLTADLVTADGTGWGVREPNRITKQVWGPRQVILAQKQQQEWTLYSVGMLRSHGARRRMQGKEGWGVSLADASCFEYELIWNEVVGFVSKEYLHWDSSILPLLLYYERVEHRETELTTADLSKC